jgi:hypothetical protein
MTLYYEMHVTTEWPGEVHFEVLKMLVRDKMPHWHMGDLLMMKNEDERSHKDVFFTARAETEIEAWVMTKGFCLNLADHGFKVIRYKLEDTLVDSRIADAWGIL